MTGRREPRCTWVAPAEEPDARFLVPGCMERVQDWDAECACKTSAQELDEADARIAELEAQLDRERDWHSAWRGVALQHRDGRVLFDRANASFKEWRRQKDAVRRMNDNPPSKETSR